MRKLILALAVVGMCVWGMTGCAPQKPLTPEEIAAERDRQIQMTTRVYKGKTPEEVLLAADRVFRLADDDYNISHQGTSLQAQRDWLVYMVITVAMGTDTWIVQTFPVENGTKIVAMHSGQGQAINAVPTANFNGGMGVTATTGPMMTNMTTYPALYQLFFARLDSLLGEKSQWVTCKEANKIFTDGSLEPLCLVANDRTPDGKTAVQRNRELEQNNQ